MEEKITHENFIKKLLQALNESQIEYMVIGGIAAVYYGRQRSTNDCDIAISLDQEQINIFCESLRKNGFSIREYDVSMGLKEKRHFNAYFGEYLFFRADFSWISSSSLSQKGFE
ncbi:hypothetical protein HZC07_01825, partial [Candidatus Micrarchaeota archaeon]|nr:hypothetical protein [Candidatus Micrarchaeota archaeon]